MVTIERTGDFFRLLYDIKGRYILHKISDQEANVCVQLNFEFFSKINQFFNFFSTNCVE